MKKFVVGQRYFSEAELDLGLGKVALVEFKNITIEFPSVKERRIYRSEAALQRYRAEIGEMVKNEKGNISFPVVEIKEENGILTYYGRGGKKLKETELQSVLKFRPSDYFRALSDSKVCNTKEFKLRQKAQQIAAAWRSSPVRGMIGPRIDMLAHQLYLCSRACSSSEMPRLMLSDEVGLGKTIEAGMIWHTLHTRNRADRTLILVPESLKHQWMVEMKNRFNQVFTLVDKDYLKSLSEDSGNISMSGQFSVSMKENPFLATNYAICTIEFLLATPALCEDLFKVAWDLLIVDEVHHLLFEDGFVCKEFKLVQTLVTKAKGVLFLSGTPMQLDPESHFHRLQMLDPVRFYDYQKFIEEQDTYKKIASDLSKLPSDPNAVLDWEELENILPKKSPIREWLAKETEKTLEAGEWVRRIVDAMGTGSVMFRNTRKGLGPFSKRILKEVPLEPNEKYQMLLNAQRLSPDFAVDEVDYCLNASLVLRQPKLWQFDERIVWLKSFLSSSKEKVLLITENEMVMKAIATELTRAFPENIFTCFFEGMSIEDRDRASADFSRPTGAQILLCTETGSEGRNFQFANRIIMWDLPLDAAMVEQRIGRLDRIGQTRDVEIYVPYVVGSSQEVMFRWYSEGLESFERPLMNAGQYMMQYMEKVLETVLEPSSKLETFVKDFLPELRKECDAERKRAEKGRDRLLEFNSRNPKAAAEIIKDIQKVDSDTSISEFVFDALSYQGIEIKKGAIPETILLEQSSEIEEGSIPGMPNANSRIAMTEESTTKNSYLTVTLSREKAMLHHEIDFLSVEHPLAQGAIDYATMGHQGAISCVLWENSGIPGTMCMEYDFVLDFPVAPTWGISEVAGSFYLRALVNGSGEDCSLLLNSIDEGTLRDVPVPQGKPVLQAKLAYFYSDGFSLAKEIVGKQVEEITEKVIERVTERLDSEYKRTRYLTTMRGGAENTPELQTMKKTFQERKKAVSQGNLRLDGIRLVVCR